MSVTSRELAMCYGKQSFDRATASRVAREHNAPRPLSVRGRSRKDKKPEVSAFRCACCGHWHVGSPPKAIRERNRYKFEE